MGDQKKRNRFLIEQIGTGSSLEDHGAFYGKVMFGLSSAGCSYLGKVSRRLGAGWDK